MPDLLTNVELKMKHGLKSDVAIFLYKALAIYIGWYILYDLWLLPDGRLDRWLVYNIVDVTSDIFLWMGYSTFWMGRYIGLTGTPGIILVNGCSGISAIGLFIGFVVAFPGRWIPRICFTFIGIGLIYLLNIVRILVLVITQKYWPGFFNFTHDYSTTALFYLAIFILWVIWVHFGGYKLINSKTAA